MIRATLLSSSAALLLAALGAVEARAQSEPFCATRNTLPTGEETDVTYQSVA